MVVVRILLQFILVQLTITCVFSTVQPLLSNLNPLVVTDYDAYEFPNDKSQGLVVSHHTGNYVSTGRPYSAYAATFNPLYFAFYPSVKKGCIGLVKTSESSFETYTCDYATNGAFFTWDITTTGSLCVGNLVSDGKVWQLPTDGSGTKRANFGLTGDGRVITGFVDENIINSSNFTQLITGWGWLVRNGLSYVNQSQDLSYQPGGFTLEKAPRTAVGVYKNGSMILLEIDGEEDINAGPDLFEVAELFVTLGVESAINIDGGGSSVSVSKGNVIDIPTCNDTPEMCERAVASITCVKSSL
eukprot:gene12741-17082_t